MLRFTKIKYKDSEIELHYERLNAQGEWDEYRFKSRQAPHPDFAAALQALDEHQVHECELLVDQADGLYDENPNIADEIARHEIISVTLSYSADEAGEPVRGVTITSLRRLFYANAPLTLNSPHKFDRKHSDGQDEEILLRAETCEAVDHLCREAEQYLLGNKRKQQNLFAGDDQQEEIHIETETV